MKTVAPDKKDSSLYNIYWAFGDGNHEEILSRVKSIPGREWNPNKRVWTIPHTELEKAQAWLPDFFFDSRALHQIKMNRFNIENSKVYDSNFPVPLSPNAPNDYFGYQKAGIFHIANGLKGKCLLGDAPGIGKTISTIGWINLDLREHLPAVVVCPACVVRNWEIELERWSLAPGQFFVLSYNRMRLDLVKGNRHHGKSFFKKEYKSQPKGYKKPPLGKALEDFGGIKTVIFDEIHRLKSYQSQAYKAAKILRSKAQYCLGLTGTPILNCHIELYAILDIIHPGLYRFQNFIDSFCKKGYFGGYKDSINGDKLQKEIRSNILLRREKKEVLKDLPPVIPSTIPVQGINYTTYEVWVDERGGDPLENPVVKWMTEVRQIIGRAKAVYAVEWLKNWFESGGGPIVNFCWHHEVADHLADNMAGIEYRKVTGNCSQDEKQEAIEALQNGQVKCLVCTDAISEGVNLVASANINIIEYPFVPAKLQQQIARLDRIGQKEPVNVRFFHGEFTLDDSIVAMLNKKARVFEFAVSDSQWIKDHSEQMKNKPLANSLVIDFDLLEGRN